GRGSTLNPDSSDPTYQHADTIRSRGIFAEVACAFWKEEPSMREVLHMLDSEDVYVVPNFISEGYFTREVILRELQLDGPVTQRDGKVIRYCDPVGIHPSMTRLLLNRADEVAPDAPRSQSTLIVVGHGTTLNEQSTKAIKDQVAMIQKQAEGFAQVIDTYMEEPPLISDWHTLSTQPNVIVVPFFIADGLHSYQDIPVMLGLEQEPTEAASARAIFRQNPNHLHGKALYYSSAIGTEPMLADVILDQVAAFDEVYSAYDGAANSSR
ncbi:MAG: cobalamin biosynthesis protein CbiX, partial [Verrucomicrobia bacterium]|nr:cobalamin biosynthesis protein CbiX [Verrucomicrobiota bacterium]